MKQTRKPKSRAKPAPESPKTSTNPEDSVIRACVEYAQAVAAYEAGHKVDTTHQWDLATGKDSKRFVDIREKALQEASKLAATTLAGLEAKALTWPYLYEDRGAAIDDDAAEFLQVVQQ